MRVAPRAFSASRPSRMTGRANSRKPLSTAQSGRRLRKCRETAWNSSMAAVERLPWPQIITPSVSLAGWSVIALGPLPSSVFGGGADGVPLPPRAGRCLRPDAEPRTIGRRIPSVSIGGAPRPNSWPARRTSIRIGPDSPSRQRNRRRCRSLSSRRRCRPAEMDSPATGIVIELAPAGMTALPMWGLRFRPPRPELTA